MILNFLSVNTAWNREKVVEFMKYRAVDAVFLDLPTSFEAYFAKKLLPPVDISHIQDLRASEPIIQYCWNEEVPIYCYLDDKDSEERKKIQIELAKLVLKAKLTEKIDVLEWKKLIFHDLALKEGLNELIAIKIHENAGNVNVCLNLSPEIENYLKEAGFEVERIQLYEFRRPIDKLYELALKEMKGEKVSNEVYLEVIKKHLIFVDSVIEVGYEEACKYLWM
ncbi:MAG: hypothetical protein NOM71_04385 [Archaeoglobi archaeon]|nr:hypothetical protein [Archaeoglobi archaeon]